MVGIVLVSHSRTLALAVEELVRSMTGPGLWLAIAAGAGDNHAELGTNAVEISEAITAVKSTEGVLVLMDMGSAILSAETALDLLDEPLRENVRFCAAPFVEGAVAAGVTAYSGAPMEEVFNEALGALKHKETALASDQATADTVPGQLSTVADDSSKPSGQTIRLKIANVHGLHARPAARLISESRPFQSEITIRNLSNLRGPVSIRSLSALASLEVLQNHEVEISASGEDAPAALDKIAQLARDGFGEAVPPDGEQSLTRSKEKPALSAQKKTAGPLSISGGIVIGKGIYFQEAQLEIPQNKIDDISAEIDRLQKAVANVQKSLEARREQMSTSVGAVNAGIYEAQILALQDPELIGKAIQNIQTERANAVFAWNHANQQIVDHYRALQDVYLRERAVDLEDVGRQVLELLSGKKSPSFVLTEPYILIADNLTPYQVSSLAKNFTLGVMLLDGSPTAHSSILLKSLGIPTVVQTRTAFTSVDLDRPGVLAFDGSSGKIWLNPDEALLAELKDRQAEEQRRENDERLSSFQPGTLLDGQRIEIWANIGQAAEAEAALQMGAEGVGLLRTEFLFLERESPPTEDDQVQALLAIADQMKAKPITVRTLDVGGDKELPYLQMDLEDNPFLGVRAIRLCFSHEDLFATQLRAILRAGHRRDFRIMFPMIANTADLSRARECLEKAHIDLEKHNVPHLWPIETGIMVEIPSAALQAEALAEHSHFFSIGTNDLTQYTLAADRGNPALTPYQDALHPSVLRLIEMIVAGARKYGRPVAVCGEAASDEIAAGIFIGLGVRELSMSGAKIPRLKAALRKRKLGDLQQQAEKALNCHSASEVRALAMTGIISNR